MTRQRKPGGKQHDTITVACHTRALYRNKAVSGTTTVSVPWDIKWTRPMCL